MPRPLTIRRTLVVDVPIMRLWELLSDTSRSNHAMGLPALAWHESRAADGRMQVIGSTRYGMLTLRWIEHPFQWIAPQTYSVEREFLDVPFINSLTTGARLTPLDSQRTEVVSETILHTPNQPGKLFAMGIATKLERDHVALIKRIEDTFCNRRRDYFPAARNVQLNWAALESRLTRLESAPIAGGGLERLLDVLQTGRDEDVSRMRPFVLADEWQLDRMAVLRLFLYATQAGLLDLHWDVLCPNCRTSRDSFGQLRDLAGQSHCDACQIEYNINFDDYVELRFAVNQAIRETVDATFCALGGPSYNRHIIAQQRLAANEQRTIQVQLPVGSYRLRILGSEQRCQITSSADGPNEVEINLSDDGVEPRELALGAGEITFKLYNHAQRHHLMILERDTWDTPFVSAALVTTLPEFRTLFSSQILSPGLGLAVRSLTIMFSDLKNSTPLYEEIGDGPAYALVRDHFDILFRVINRHSGTVVKTIGDAVMAVFPSPQAGVEAAFEMLKKVREYNQTNPESVPLILKLGLHAGPCIAVTANDVLDYFGTTVNAAARAQTVSTGDDIIITSDVMDEPSVQTLIEHQEVAIEHFTRDLKGLQRPYDLYRLRETTATALGQALG